MTLAGIMTLSMLSACSSSSSTTESSSSTSTESVEQLKVAWICDGVFTDGGWNADGYACMQEMAELYSLDVSYQENVSTTDVADVLRNYAADGYELIISNEQYHAEDMVMVAQEFPSTTFSCMNGYVSTDNMIGIISTLWQCHYLAGVMAGMETQSNKIGLITYATDSDTALTYKAAFGGGAQSVNPDVQIIHVATGSFSDLVAGKDMATSLLDQGCDVIYCNSGDCNETVIEVTVEAGAYAVSAVVDRNSMDEYILGSTLASASMILPSVIEGYVNGTLTGSSEPIVLGIADGGEEFLVNPDFPMSDGTMDALEAAAAAIADGSVTIG